MPRESLEQGEDAHDRALAHAHERGRGHEVERNRPRRQGGFVDLPAGEVDAHDAAEAGRGGNRIAVEDAVADDHVVGLCQHTAVRVGLHDAMRRGQRGAQRLGVRGRKLLEQRDRGAFAHALAWQAR